MAKPHLGHEPLKPSPIDGACPRLTQVLINDHNARGIPAQRNGSLAQAILARGAFGIFEHLMESTLAHVQHGLTREMSCGDFVQCSRLNWDH